MRSIRDGFGDGLLKIGSDPRVVVLVADLTDSLRVSAFKNKYPKRCIEVGVCEQNLIGVAAGMAHLGKKVFATGFAAFNPGRNWDQIRVSLCYQDEDVVVVGSHAGVSTGEDGATHQALEDIAITRCLPNMTVVVPCDYNQAVKATEALYKHKGPSYLRLSRIGVEAVSNGFELGKIEVLCEGPDVTIVACGLLVAEALKAEKILRKKNIRATVLNAHTIKPFDEKTLLFYAYKTGCVVSCEEHQQAGGLFSVVSELLARKYPVPVEAVAVKDCFGQSGKADELLTYYGLRAEDIVLAVTKAVKRKVLR